MIKSAEVRWFFHPEPIGIRKWFEIEGGEKYCSHERRTDYYFDLESCDSLSFKIRDGRIELKTLAEVIGNTSFTPSIDGSVELWSKWSSVLKSGLQIPEQIFETPEMFEEVKKRRYMIRFERLGDTSLRKAIKEEKLLQEGCQVELTKIEARKKEFYSFGLEAFGRDENLLNTLFAVSKKVFNDLADVNLSASNSQSYSSFLSSFNRRNTGT